MPLHDMSVSRYKAQRNNTYPSGRVEGCTREYTWGIDASVGAGGGYSFVHLNLYSFFCLSSGYLAIHFLGWQESEVVSKLLA